jgi:hypothetical protein
MISIFSEMVECFLAIFMDNFSIFGSSFEECLHCLTLVFVRCKEKNLVLNWEKCHFMLSRVLYWGTSYLAEGLRRD